MQNPVAPILDWYARLGRDLPWRDSRDAYRVWLSEVIMQQTRIDQGTAYFHRFVTCFPTVHDLAAADADLVMKCWEGLGYYSRARNLHATAKFISTEMGGNFPDNYLQLQKLKGIGPYTARAIGSIAFGNLVGVVDGNVQRVLSRYLADPTPVDTADSRRSMQLALDQWISEAHAIKPASNLTADFNQGMMDLGAMVCKPAQPLCGECPLQPSCMAEKEQMQLSFPVKRGKLQRKTVYTHFYIVEQEDGNILIQRRPEKGVWGGLWELPNRDVDKSLWAQDQEEGSEFQGAFKHVFTHMDMMIKVYRTERLPMHAQENARFVMRENLGEFAFSRAVLKIFDRFLP